MITTRGIDFICYQVSNLEKALDFYHKVLGLTPSMKDPNGMWAEFDLPPITFSLYCDTSREEPIPKASGTVFFAVDDIEKAVNTLKAQEIPVAFGPLETPVCHMAIIEDPDGNDVGLHTRKDGSFG